MKFIVLPAGAAIAALLSLSVAQAESPLGMKKGAGGSEVQGSAGTTGSQGDSGQEHCDKPMGAMLADRPWRFATHSTRGSMSLMLVSPQIIAN